MNYIQKQHKSWISTCLIFSLSLLFCKDLFFAASLFAQSNPDDLLEKGIEAYEEVDFEVAAQSLNQALKLGLQKKEQLARAFQYLAFAYAALGDTAQSKTAYLELLGLDPDFNLPVSASPRLRGPYLAAQKVIAERDTSPPVITPDHEAPQIAHKPPAEATEGQAVTLTATITDNVGIKSAALRFRKKNEQDFKSVLMKDNSRNQYEARIPVNEIAPPSLQYYITASDAAGNSGFWKSAELPYTLKVKAKPKAQSEQLADAMPDKKKKGGKTWLWIGLGAAVVGGAVVGLAGGGGGGDEPTTGSIKIRVPE